MFKILDGRQAFYQWDIDQRVVVEDRSITQVHYCNRTDDCALICECYELDSLWVADVPNILLQDNWRIRVYAYDGCATRHEQRFDVIARSKPDTYVYTETEVLNYETIKAQMDRIDSNIDGVVRDYLEENPIEIDLTGMATEKYVDDAVAAIDIPETDLTGYATEQYVNEQISKIEIPDPDLSDYYTKEEANELYVTAEAVESMIPDVSQYQTSDQVQTAINTALAAIGVAEEGVY